LSFLTKLAQAELLTGVSRIKAVIGPDSDGGFSISSLRRPRPSARAISVEGVGQKNTDAEKGE
jgi:glycosyltransferase A (GT-A) superfamily protein (DUF2064 family)